MNEMIERVAKAIGQESRVYGDDELYHMGSDDNETGKEAREALARAAIEAMREPTWDMCQAGALSPYEEAAHDMYDAKEGWQKMIDAALKE